MTLWNHFKPLNVYYCTICTPLLYSLQLAILLSSVQLLLSHPSLGHLTFNDTMLDHLSVSA